MQPKTTYYLFSMLLMLFACTSQQEVADSIGNDKPADNRFTKVILTQGMDEPMEMAFLPNEKILIIERKGGVKLFDENRPEEIKHIATIPVNTKYKNKKGDVREAEEGLMGVIAHPDYANNNWIFMYYADPDESKHVLARWEFRDNQLIEGSKKIVLEVPTQREECCHTGGGMTFDAAGNLFLTVGNNTVNPRNGASNLVELPGEENSDDQRGPSNSNDLRGKILRIHPEDDGTYTIPAGNLFPKGMEKTRPEIYTMGHRNPWRPTLDSQTGYLYWGEVGPDANSDGEWGTKGYDEFNQAKAPGFFGWPYFIANNRTYNKYNSEEKTYSEPFDPANPVNESVNNTGVQKLPLPVPAMIYYPYGPSDEFPLVGSAGRSATGGPVFRQADFKNAPRPFPAYYEGKWLIVDFMRDWIMAVSMDDNGDYLSMERFLPEENFNAAIALNFGSTGDLYVLEYGDAWFRQNANARLVKIEYNAGNRKPMVAANADKLAGAVPFTVQFSSDGTKDYDKYDEDKLSYEWDIFLDEEVIESFDVANPKMAFEQAGVYEVILTVTDTKDASNDLVFEIVAGNEPPIVNIDFQGVNKSFYFGTNNLPYSIKITDKEDGSTTDGSILPEATAITFDYVPAGFDPIEVAAKQSGAQLLAVDAIGKQLIESNDCRSCHQYDTKSIGPSYTEVAKKYKDTPENRALLEDRVINGSSGIWGEHAMAAHPALSQSEAQRMVRYIMTILEEKPTIEQLALKGNLSPTLPEGEDGLGIYVLRAGYEDKGGEGGKSLLGAANLILRNPTLFPQMAEIKTNTQLLTTPTTNFFLLGPTAHLGYQGIDMTSIQQIDLFVKVSPGFGAHGGFVEARLDSPNGRLIGKSETVAPKPVPWGGFGGPKKMMTPLEYKTKRRKGTQTLSVLLEPVEGIHDIYFVFKNEAAKANEILMAVKEIEVYNHTIVKK